MPSAPLKRSLRSFLLQLLHSKIRTSIDKVFFKTTLSSEEELVWLNVELPGYFINASNWSTQLSVLRGEE
jgi:hypothetical protein